MSNTPLPEHVINILSHPGLERLWRAIKDKTGYWIEILTGG